MISLIKRYEKDPKLIKIAQELFQFNSVHLAITRTYYRTRSAQATGEIFHCSKTQILKYLRQAGIQPYPQGRPKLNTDGRDERKVYHNYAYLRDSARKHGFTSVDTALKTLYDEHQSFRVVGEMLDVSANTVKNHLIRLEHPILKRPRGGAHNLNGTNAPKYTIDGIPLKQWCKENNRKYAAMANRFRHGWTEEEVKSISPNGKQAFKRKRS